VAIPLRVSGAGEPAGIFAGYLAAFGVGGFVGAALGGIVPRRLLLVVTLVGVAGVGGFSILAGLLPLGPIGWLVYALAGACWGPFPATTTTLLQRSATKGQLSSVLAARSSLQIFALPLGSLIAGPVVASIGPVLTIVGAGILIVLLAGALAPVVVRIRESAEEHPSPPN
jgi:MFS family permease